MDAREVEVKILKAGLRRTGGDRILSEKDWQEDSEKRAGKETLEG